MSTRKLTNLELGVVILTALVIVIAIKAFWPTPSAAYDSGPIADDTGSNVGSASTRIVPRGRVYSERAASGNLQTDLRSLYACEPGQTCITSVKFPIGTAISNVTLDPGPFDPPTITVGASDDGNEIASVTTTNRGSAAVRITGMLEYELAAPSP